MDFKEFYFIRVFLVILFWILGCVLGDAESVGFGNEWEILFCVMFVWLEDVFLNVIRVIYKIFGDNFFFFEGSLR